MTKPQGEGWLTPAKPENATSVRLTSFGGFVFLFTDVILTVQNATRFFRASSETDCVTFVAGLMLTKDDDAASVDHGVTENLDAEALCLRVTTVAGGTAAFLVCHFLCSLQKIVT